METCGIKVGWRKGSILRCADDTCVKLITEVTAIIEKLNKVGEKKNLKLKAKKTIYVYNLQRNV